MSKLRQRNAGNPLTDPFQVLAFDPGQTTGWSAALYVPTHLVESVEDVKLDDIKVNSGEFSGDHHEQLFRFIHECARDQGRIPTHLVCEPFDFRQFARAEGDGIGKSKLELVSREYIGVVRLCSQLLGLPYAGFQAGEAKDWCPNGKLDKLGWLQRPVHPMRHKNDAFRQLVKYLVVHLRVRHPLTTSWRD